MDSFYADCLTAIWFGILTSISPCPLAANIAAVSFISKQAHNNRSTLRNGLGYTLGRVVTYTVLGAVLVTTTHAIPGVSFFLQQYMRILIGPILIITGAFMLGLLNIPIKANLLSPTAQERLGRAGWLGAFIIGMVFALAFCPVSAGLFFGSTFGLAVKHSSRVLIPLLYGLGTALPVILFAFVIAFSARTLGIVFKRMTVFEKWARRISGAVICLIGLYLLLSLFSG